MSAPSWNRAFRAAIVLLGGWLVFDLVAHLLAESLWFAQLGYLAEFLLRIKTQAILWAIAFGVTTVFLGSNHAIARRLEYQSSDAGEGNSDTGLGLGTILVLSCLLAVAIALVLLYYGQVTIGFWQPDLTLPNLMPDLPPRLNLNALWMLVRQLPAHPLQGGLLAGIAILLLVRPQFSSIAISTVMSLGFGTIVSGQWAKILQSLNATSFNLQDPLFSQDIRFYVFILPIGELLEFWWIGLCAFALASVTLTYLLSGEAISRGSFPGFSWSQQRHLHGLGGFTLLAVGFSVWLHRYELLYSTTSVTYGAGYSDVWVRLPAYTVLSWLAAGMGAILMWRAIFWSPRKTVRPFQKNKRKPQSESPRSILGYTLSGFALAAFVLGWVLPAAVQRIIVQPNELAREAPYIERSIRFTRQGFDLETIEVKTFNPQTDLTTADLRENDLTIRNVRLWDTRPLLETNRQLQQIRLYYKFPNADIDRYTLKKEPTPQDPRTTENRQTIVAARELDYSAVPEQAQTWVNEHLVYTHGYGFTMSPVNTAAASGLPEYFVRGIGTGTPDETGGPVRATSERIRASIPISHPRIYYGELTDTYVMTGTEVQELDYPSGDQNVYNTYSGLGGIQVGTGWRRWVFAQYLNDWRMMLTGDFTAETKLLFRRNIKARVKAIAPFLIYDSDPYLAIANANLYSPEVSPSDRANTQDNYLYWILDAYTTSDRYPYSDMGENSFNYIRNSVKVVIDAYNGSVNFYIANPDDPILKTWQAIFPEMFQPLESMPLTLRTHIRYPGDLFSVQSERLLIYHMTDPQVFYNREDQWQVPTEIYRNEPQPVEPYYLIMKLPTATSEEFILLHPFTPQSRSNLIAWLAGRSDGRHYGKLLLYQFPKQELVYGPGQIEARINQDPLISQQISLWDRQGSRVIQGNLLVIPIKRSLLYVEPLYLEAEQNSLPTLARVIVAYENSIAMAETLEQALDAIFQPENISAPAILRSVEELFPSIDDVLPPAQEE